MMRVLIIFGLFWALGGHAAYAAARELSPEEMRENVDNGRTRSLAAALDIVSRNVEGQTIDVRAFDADGICYRMLVLQPSGKLVSVIVDAVSGKFLDGTSSRGKQVTAAAQKSKGKSSGSAGKTAKNGKSGTSNGNSGNASGQGGGKGNGQGNGQGGNNGNGQGGGQGNGNGGGNGGGNGKK